MRLIAATIVSGLPSGAGAVSNASDGRIDVGRVDVERRGVGGRLRRGLIARSAAAFTSASTSRAMRLELRLGRQPFGLDEVLRGARSGSRCASAARSSARLVELLVVGERVRVRADDFRVDERRTLAGARVRDRLRMRAIAREEVGAVDALHEAGPGTTRRASRCRRRRVCTSTGTEIA